MRIRRHKTDLFLIYSLNLPQNEINNNLYRFRQNKECLKLSLIAFIFLANKRPEIPDETYQTQRVMARIRNHNIQTT